MSRKSLGRGLEALLPAASASSVEQIPVESIDPNPQQPRRAFSAESLEELARSVAKQGILQPVLVRRKGLRFELIVGERRWRAAAQAGLATIPALVSDHPDEHLLELALIENLQREDLGPLEVAQAYRMLMEKNDLTQEALAERVGKKRSSVANYLRLLELPPEVKEAVQNERLSMGHARALSGLDSAEMQASLARQVEQKDLSVREVEELVRKKKRAPRSQTRPARTGTRVHLDAVEERLAEALGTPVLVQGTDRRGRIVVEYYSQEQLNALVERLER
jgi:ParB family transcriptional regulator, chromosome partitioning protein